MFPFYLRDRLHQLGIDSVTQLTNLGYLKAFHYLKLTHPSTSYKALFDLYSICLNLKIGNLTLEQKNHLKTEYRIMPPSYLPLALPQINHFLQLAEEQAMIAQRNHEIPIGAIIVKNNRIIASGYNQTLQAQNITAHAEIIALEKASKIIGSHRLDECDLYVTLEPCLMCSGAIIHSRIQRLIFGATEFKTGAISSQYNVFTNLNVNHHTEVIGPINQKLYSNSIQEFFSGRR